MLLPNRVIKFLKEKYIKSTSLQKIIVIYTIVAVIIPCIAKLVYNNNTWAEWYATLFTYSGGVTGGVATLIAIIITTNETRRIQRENRDKELEAIKRSMQFKKVEEIIGLIDDIIELMRDYSCTISINLSTLFTHENVEKVREYVNSNKTIIFKKIMKSSDIFDENRIIFFKIHDKDNIIVHSDGIADKFMDCTFGLLSFLNKQTSVSDLRTTENVKQIEININNIESMYNKTGEYYSNLKFLIQKTYLNDIFEEELKAIEEDNSKKK